MNYYRITSHMFSSDSTQVNSDSHLCASVTQAIRNHFSKHYSNLLTEQTVQYLQIHYYNNNETAEYYSRVEKEKLHLVRITKYTTLTINLS